MEQLSLEQENKLTFVYPEDVEETLIKKWYIMSGEQLLDLLLAYHNCNNKTKAAYIWIYNIEDNLDERNRYGVPEDKCL